MRRLFKNQDFQVLRSQWVHHRGLILAEGKDKQESKTWAELAGFDKAVMLPEDARDYVSNSGSRGKDEGAPTSDLER